MPAPFGVRILLCLALAGGTLLAGGCAVGPDFSRPSAPAVSQYARTPLAATVATPGDAAGATQRVVRGAKVDGHWWRLFHSPALDALEQQALAHSPTLAAAQAALRAAHEQALAGRGAYAPSVGAGVSAVRNQDPPAALAPVPSNNAYLYNLFTPQLDIAYAPDVSGLERRREESLAARAQAARFAAVAAYDTLTTNVVVATVEAASLAAQVKATQKLVDLDRQLLDTLAYRRDSGYASGADVAVQRAQLAQTETSLPALRKQLAAARHRLAVLCGRFPGQAELKVPSLSD